MFQDALFVPEKNVRVRGVALPLAALVHGLLALFLIVLPLMRSGDLPGVEFRSVFLAPPPPVPAPPPPKGRPHAGRAVARIKPVTQKMSFESGPLTAPVNIPTSITEESLGWGGSDAGVPGGVDYGAAGGYPKDLIGRALYEVIGDEAAPVRVVGEVRMPKLLKRVEPDYPEIAQQARVQGTVILEATTDVYGRVVSVKILRSVPLLDGAAIDAVRRWIYEPMVINGRPRGVTFTVTVRFELK
jgi:protein TonB